MEMLLTDSMLGIYRVDRKRSGLLYYSAVAGDVPICVGEYFAAFGAFRFGLDIAYLSDSTGVYSSCPDSG